MLENIHLDFKEVLKDIFWDLKRNSDLNQLDNIFKHDPTERTEQKELFSKKDLNVFIDFYNEFVLEFEEKEFENTNILKLISSFAYKRALSDS